MRVLIKMSWISCSPKYFVNLFLIIKSRATRQNNASRILISYDKLFVGFFFKSFSRRFRYGFHAYVMLLITCFQLPRWRNRVNDIKRILHDSFVNFFLLHSVKRQRYHAQTIVTSSWLYGGYTTTVVHTYVRTSCIKHLRKRIRLAIRHVRLHILLTSEIKPDAESDKTKRNLKKHHEVLRFNFIVLFQFERIWENTSEAFPKISCSLRVNQWIDESDHQFLLAYKKCCRWDNTPIISIP